MVRTNGTDEFLTPVATRWQKTEPILISKHFPAKVAEDIINRLESFLGKPLGRHASFFQFRRASRDKS